MRYLTLSEVLLLHDRTLATSGGSAGLRDLARIESAVAQPKATFDGAELYTSVAEKAAALAFSLIQGHGFVDGNKRVGHAAMEVFLVLMDARSAPMSKSKNALSPRSPPRRCRTKSWRYGCNPISRRIQSLRNEVAFLR